MNPANELAVYERREQQVFSEIYWDGYKDGKNEAKTKAISILTKHLNKPNVELVDITKVIEEIASL